MFTDYRSIVLGTVVGISAVVTSAISAAAIWLHRLHKRYDHIPGPKRSSFWLGNYDLILKLVDGNYTFNELNRDLSLQYGKTYCIWFLWNPMVATLDPVSIKTLLSSSERKSVIRYGEVWGLFGERFLGRGLVTDTDPTTWGPRRRALNPAFHRLQLREAMGVFNQTADTFIKKIRIKVMNGEATFDILDLLHRTTSDVIAKVAFHADFASLEEDDNQFYQDIKDILRSFQHSLKNPLMTLNPFSNRAYKTKARECMIRIRTLGHSLLMERLKLIQDGKEVPFDVASLIMKAWFESIKQGNASFEFEAIVDDFLTFFVAGEDTTANTVAFMLRETAMHPSVMGRLQAEIEDEIGNDPSGNIELDDLKKLSFLKCVMKETLRLFPAAGRTFRDAEDDMFIEGFYIPKGTPVGVDIYATHHHPELHMDPEEFIPERFSEGSLDKPTPYTYLPFSLGPRACLGRKFAEIEAQVLMIKLLQAFDLTWVENQPYGFVEDTTSKPSSSLFNFALK